MDLTITVDVEKDVGAVETCYGIDEGLPVILEIMRQLNVKGTFFISGEILDYLEKTNSLKSIIDDNHEIASHGYRHLDYREWSEQRIADEINLSITEIEQRTGIKVAGYRSPQFRVNERVIKVIKQIGLKYDSSIPDDKGFSAASLLRGVKFDPEFVNGISDDNFREFIIDSVPTIGIPHGMFWINFLGFNLYKYFFKKFNKKHVVLYMHPFDFISYKSRVKCPTLLENILYPFREDKIPALFENMLSFYKKEKVDFVTLEEKIKEP